ncbi:hypothetical protein BDB01DRAFT_356188 [Pilobolus umbonatus]|nr:hypothetical protein BDB01DRAFT_356188 [Pilobolus umbonatus]
MNYHYYKQQHTVTDNKGTSVIIHELTDSELSTLRLEEDQLKPVEYEIADEDRLTEDDFYRLMASDESDTESESDVEYHWFPSLLNSSVIQLLDDDSDLSFMTEDTDYVEIVETESEEEDDPYDNMEILDRKRMPSSRQYTKNIKRHKRSEQVPIEVVVFF